MSANKFTEVPHTIGCKISQDMVCLGWLQSDGAICNRRAINHILSILEGLATLIGSHLTRESTTIPVLTKWWKSELMLATNFGSLCPKVTKVGSQNFGYQICFFTRLVIKSRSDESRAVRNCLFGAFDEYLKAFISVLGPSSCLEKPGFFSLQMA